MENVSSRCGKSDNAPRLRFPEFRGEWEEKRFSELFSFISNNTLSRAELSDAGEIKNIHYGDILVKYGAILSATDIGIPFVVNSKKIKKSDFLKDGDIIISDTAEDETVGKAIEIIDSKNIKLVAGLHTIACRPKLSFGLAYLGYYINSPSFHYQLIPLMQGIKVTSISKSNILTTFIRFPSLPEQKKIAAFFTLLDRRIQKQRQLVEFLKTYKRGVIKQYFSAQKDNTKWTKSTISNCLFYEQPQKYIVHSEHYSNTYETPVLTANKAFILGYTNELDGIYDKGDVLIYDDFTMEVKYVDFPFKVKSSTIKMLTPQSGIDLYFMFTLLKSLDLQPEGHQRSYISILEPMEVNIPCYEEQTIASRIFRLLDKQIEKEQQLLHKILDLKSSLLQKMFI